MTETQTINKTETQQEENGGSRYLQTRVIRHASLFTGIGGFDLAAEWMRWKNIFQVEIDDYCQKVLELRFPNVKKYRNIYEFSGIEYYGKVDLISGGFPCQPFSVAGKRKGKADDRYLWPEMLRVLSEIKPTWIVGENVPGIVKMELDNMLDDLERVDYETQTFVIPAASVDARHRRERIWIIANSTSNRRDHRRTLEQGRQNKGIENRKTEEDKQIGERRIGKFSQIGKTNTNTEKQRLERQVTKRKICTCGLPTEFCRWKPEPRLDRVANGVPHRVDRLKCLGNAIVPQLAYQIFWAIQEVTYNI